MTSVKPDRGPVIISPEKFRRLPDVIRDDTPENRIHRLSLLGRQSLYALTPAINQLVTSPEIPRTPPPGQVIVKSRSQNGLHSTLGIDYKHDLARNIFPVAAGLAREVARADLDEQEKLRRLANMAGTMITEAQSFMVGNKRTARAMYGRILYGRGEGMARGHNEDIDFGPPLDIDRQVMLQSVSRLRAERDGTITPPQLGGVYVEPDVEKSLIAAAESVQSFCRRFGGEVEERDDSDANVIRIQVALESRVPNKSVRSKVIGVLLQEHYGPAAASLVFDNPCDIFESLNTATIVDLVETNTRLLEMRIKSFMAAAACGGYFVSIEDANEEGRERRIVKTKWEPEVSPIDYDSPKHSTVRV